MDPLSPEESCFYLLHRRQQQVINGDRIYSKMGYFFIDGGRYELKGGFLICVCKEV